MARILITGSSQGIGAECARQLLDLGHEVVLHARDGRRAQAAIASNPGALAVVTGDLSSIEETRALASAANEHGPYDVIIHNAGIGGGATSRTETADGLEEIFQVNVVGPYLLTALMPIAPRMIYLTSGLEADGTWVPADLQWSTRDWNGMQAYSDSKLHDSMLAFEIASRHPEAIVNVVDPGWIKTALGGEDAWDEVEDGAETQVWLAVFDDPAATVSGRYVKRRETLNPNPIVEDADARAGLVAELERVTGVSLG
ncbi:SDR family NAD(P)-dependent oxidoreductase [Demequina sp. NBRC 110053]|uniref:SDR family NAD(P)-dependent oxidoreductase n=1 Tax=Demequina sp. NBRC 110053 TaxID=1570342 RepID=UPI000A0232B9|nr:SDR family NAD(P)-dependent oxidoreductase [Demequina sp. NBRC 110053]